MWTLKILNFAIYFLLRFLNKHALSYIYNSSLFQVNTESVSPCWEPLLSSWYIKLFNSNVSETRYSSDPIVLENKTPRAFRRLNVRLDEQSFLHLHFSPVLEKTWTSITLYNVQLCSLLRAPSHVQILDPRQGTVQDRVRGTRRRIFKGTFILGSEIQSVVSRDARQRCFTAIQRWI